MFITNITRLFVIDASNESGTENYDDLELRNAKWSCDKSREIADSDKLFTRDIQTGYRKSTRDSKSQRAIMA